MWGCGDSGRLGLGRPLIPMFKPALVKNLLHEQVAAISCGSSHTAVITEVNFESESGVQSVSGGKLFVCGAAAILKVGTHSHTHTLTLQFSPIRQQTFCSVSFVVGNGVVVLIVVSALGAVC